jgi:hypothetical protein
MCPELVYLIVLSLRVLPARLAGLTGVTLIIVATAASSATEALSPSAPRGIGLGFSFVNL